MPGFSSIPRTGSDTSCNNGVGGARECPRFVAASPENSSFVALQHPVYAGRSQEASIMKSNASQLRPDKPGRTVATGSGIAALAARAWAELNSPPRPAWIIIAERSAKRRGEITLRFAR
jgi:hypothetical protein